MEVELDGGIEPLVGNYMTNRRKDIAALQEALDGADFGRIAALGHRMKGNGASFGFHRISELGVELEDAAMGEDASAVATALAALSDYVDNVKVVYR
ncbi:MAG: Hpt domain-containing protein [Pseudomonadota bacterium]